MKHLLILAIVALSFQINAQPKCVTGDCKNGYGKLVTPEYTYEGTFGNGKFLKGKLVMKSGEILDGSFSEGKLTSGKYTFSDGSIWEGKFVEGKIEGKGKQVNSDGDVIEGEFHEGRIINGIWEYTNNKELKYYEGSFAYFNGAMVYNGKGTLYMRNGNKLGPNWKNGDPIGNGEAKAEIPEGKLGIELKKQGGVYLIKGNITRDGYSHTYDFVFDTGASLVSVPFSVLKTLYKQNIVTDADFKNKISLQTASGDVVSGMTFNIKELELKTTDGKSVRLFNVEAVVKTDQIILESLDLAAEPPILLGQSAISKLKKFELDYEQNLLLINN
ncbi:MAG: hypothetical protein RLZZ71_2268 [Bacteroidota bacterium]|jgi:hypothetical protein